MVSVSDTGIRLKEDRETMPLNRLKRRPCCREGTGLGLYLSNKLALLGEILYA